MNWKVSSDKQKLSNGGVSLYGYSITLEDIANLMAENPETCKGVLEKLATATAKKVGNNHPLVIDLETLVGTHFPPPTPPEPVGRIVDDDTEFDGLDGWGADPPGDVK